MFSRKEGIPHGMNQGSNTASSPTGRPPGDQGAVHPMTGTVLMLFFGLPVRTRSL
jgi:hypothetical protein